MEWSFEWITPTIHQRAGVMAGAMELNTKEKEKESGRPLTVEVERSWAFGQFSMTLSFAAFRHT